MIKIRGFTKRYDDLVAVDKLDLDIDKGDIFGFIGPNGSGKTTTIRFLGTLLEPTEGEAWINGFSVTKQVRQVRRSMGFMPDTFGVYDGMRVWEFLDFFALAYEIPRVKRRAIIDDVLALVDLHGKREAPVTALSRGMQQRLCLARALVHDPPVLILDEPASGLDPRARIEMKALLKALQEMGKTILISSHILSELADCCNKIGIIERGKLLAAGTVQEIIESVRQKRQIRLEVHDRVKDAERILVRTSGTDNVVADGLEVNFEFDGTREALVDLHAKLIHAGVPLLWFRELETDLMDVFMAVTEGKVQ